MASPPILHDKTSSGHPSLPPIIIPSRSSRGRNNRGFSSQLQRMLKKQSEGIAEMGIKGDNKESKVNYEPKSWKQLSEREFSKLTLIERSRYLAYEPMPKDVVDIHLLTLKRLKEVKDRERDYNQNSRPALDDIIDFEQNSELVGQLKAAEARQRLLKIREQGYNNEKLAHLIDSQPTSIEAVRLKCFIPPPYKQTAVPDILGKKERIRCEQILEDDKGLTHN